MTNFNNLQSDFCFCTLALGHSYHILAQSLAQDLKKFAPGKYIVIGTDNPEAFQDYDNVLAFKLKQTGILKCYNDKRFILAESFLNFQTAIFIDADTKIVGDISPTLQIAPGIIGYHENLLEHIQKYRPQNVEHIKRVAAKLNIPIEESVWIGESLVIFTRDQGKEQEFIEVWGKIASYLELQGMHSGQGNIMGLAATKAGLTVQVNETLKQINKTRKHIDFGRKRQSIGKPSQWSKVQKKLNYYYRLGNARIASLKDFDFYYK